MRIGGHSATGAARFDGTDLAALTEHRLRSCRGKPIALVTQHPMTALDPVQRIGDQVDVMATLHLGLSRGAARARTVDLLTTLSNPCLLTAPGRAVAGGFVASLRAEQSLSRYLGQT